MTSLPSPINQPAVPQFLAVVNVSTANIATANITTLNVGNTITNNLVVTGQTFIALDFTTWEFEDDFTHATVLGAINGATSATAEHAWGVNNIGANANCKLLYQMAADGLHMGVWGLSANGTGTGNGAVLFAGGGAGAVGFVNPNTQTFVYKTAFQMSTTTSIGAFLGFSGNGTQTTPANVNTANFLGIRNDTSVDGANLMFIGCGPALAANTWKDSGVAASTGWHRLTITGFANGSVGFNLDGNATTAIVSTVPSALMDFGTIQLITRATGSPQLNVDYVGIQATVGTR